MAAGGILIALAMLLALPVAIMLVGALWSALAGWVLTDDVERRASPG